MATCESKVEAKNSLCNQDVADDFNVSITNDFNEENKKENKSIKVWDGISKEKIEMADKYLDNLECAIEF